MWSRPDNRGRFVTFGFWLLFLEYAGWVVGNGEVLCVRLVFSGAHPTFLSLLL